jgi:hypothetical protein
MKVGGDPRRRLRRTATALVALTLLPVAFMIGAAHPPATPAPGWATSFDGRVLRAQDVEMPSVEAMQRGQASNLFAPFRWDGRVVSGPFVQFVYDAETGAIQEYLAVNGSQASALIDSIRIEAFAPNAPPVVSGATFAVSSNDAMIVAHDEPMTLLEVRTLGQPQNVTLVFPGTTTGLAVSRATSWPVSTLSFTDGKGSGRVIVGRGSLQINETTVTASLAADDYLAVRAVPEFVEHAAERTAVLDAFASGRLAAEFDLVAVSNGGWMENSALYQAGLQTLDSSVQFSRVALSLGTPSAEGGLVLLAFDPQTMPVDSLHHLVVRTNGTDIPETSDPLASLFALPGSSDHPAYVRLAMNATVVAVYVPDLSSARLQIQSLPVPPKGIDRPTLIAIVAAMFVVAVAAAIMFRRRST